MANLSEIIISSTPLDNDKLHAADGALLGATYTYNYDTVGTVNNSGGVVSGFGTNNYIELPDDFIANNNPFDIIIKFTTGDDVTTSQRICCLYRTTWAPVQFNIYNGKCYAETNATSYQSTYNTPINIVANTTYKIKLSFDGNDKYTFYNNVNNNWTEIASMTNGALDTRPFTCRFGCTNDTSQQDQTTGTLPFLGSIDLNETSISINNQTWWQYEATSSNPYADFVTYMAELYNDDPNAEYFAKAVSEDNIITIGSLISNNGIISGFNSTQPAYATADITGGFNPINNPWRLIVSFTTGSDISTGQQIITARDNNSQQVFRIGISSSKIFLNIDSVSSGVIYSDTIIANTAYKVSVEYTGSEYKYSIFTNNSWILVQTINISNTISAVKTLYLGCSGSSGASEFLGSIDLNETSININNVLLWQGATHYDTPEQAWQYEYNKYGVCDKFVYDSTNNTVRLPKYGNNLYTTDNTASNVYYYIQIKE